MKLELSVKCSELKEIFNVLASDEDLSEHLESFSVSSYYETIKVRSYNVSISTKDQTFINKITDVITDRD